MTNQELEIYMTKIDAKLDSIHTVTKRSEKQNTKDHGDIIKRQDITNGNVSANATAIGDNSVDIGKIQGAIRAGIILFSALSGLSLYKVGQSQGWW
jgi:hypothetical protein